MGTVLKHNYRIVNSYEDNSGSMDKMKIVELDDFCLLIQRLKDSQARLRIRLI